MRSTMILFLLVIAVFPLDVFSQALDTLQQQKKLALVIGNGNYQTSIQVNPENDAKAMKGALQNVGFTVLEYENLSQKMGSVTAWLHQRINKDNLCATDILKYFQPTDFLNLLYDYLPDCN